MTDMNRVLNISYCVFQINIILHIIRLFDSKNNVDLKLISRCAKNIHCTQSILWLVLNSLHKKQAHKQSY